MNYSRLEIEKKQKELTSTSVKMQYRVKEWMRYCCVFGTVVFVLFFVFTAIGVVRGLVDSAPKIRELTLMPSGEASKMYDADGEVIQTVGAANSVQQNVSIADIPQVVQNALLLWKTNDFLNIMVLICGESCSQSIKMWLVTLIWQMTMQRLHYS